MKSIEKLTNNELLHYYEEKVECHHYCPVECNHNNGYSLYDLKDEILRRMR